MAGRIRIEPYKPLDIRTSAIEGGGYINVDASAGRFGPPSWLQFGAQDDDGATAMARTLSERLARDDEAAVKNADLRLGEAEQALLFDPAQGYLNTQGEAALNRAPEVIDAYGEAQRREMDRLSSDAQRQMLEDLAQRRLTSFSEQVERHGTAERQRWHDTASERRIDQMRADAGFYWSDDALLRRALGTIRAEVREKAERHGLPSPLTEAALSQQTSRTLVAAIEAAVERNPARAQALRTRYDQHIEAHDRAALDALLSEAQTRQSAQAASAEILNATPPDGEQPTPQWRLRQAEAITDPTVRAATIRHLHSATAAEEARARSLADQVLARVLKGGLTDTAQIPVRDWVTLHPEHRQAIETRLDHNAAGTEPAPNPGLVDQLAHEMIQAPGAFARRDLVPAVAHLPLPQWQRLHGWQAGLRHNDPATGDQLYAIKRGLQLANKMLPADTPGDYATNTRADLVEEIDIWRGVNGRNPDDDDIAGMFQRSVKPLSFVPPPHDGVDRREQSMTNVQMGGGGGQPRGPRGGTGSGQTVQQAQWDIYLPALQRVQRFNPEYREIYPKDYVPSRGDILRLNALGTAYARIHDFFQAHGISLAPRAYEQIRQQELRGVSLQSILNAYRRGETFYNPTNQPTPNRYVRRNPDGLSVGVTEPNGGRIQSVFESEIVPGWQILGRGPGTNRPSPEPDAPHTPTWPRNAPPPDTRRHHDTPQDNWNPERADPWPFSKDARDVFDRKTITVMKGDHKWDTEHAAYNRAVSAAIEKYLVGPPTINPETMTAKEAEALYLAVIVNNPEVQAYRKKMLESNHKLKAKYPTWEDSR